MSKSSLKSAVLAKRVNSNIVLPLISVMVTGIQSWLTSTPGSERPSANLSYTNKRHTQQHDQIIPINTY